MTVNPAIFKAYDIRGIYPTDLNETVASEIAKAYLSVVSPSQMILGRDARTSGPGLHKAVLETILSYGVDVIDVGLVSSDMFYYACATKKLPGMMITASHNPKEYNGFKMVKEIPYFLTGDNEIASMKEMVVSGIYPNLPASGKGTLSEWNIDQAFVDFIFSKFDPSSFKPVTILADTANGMVGPILERMAPVLPSINIIPMFFEPDGTFPNHGGDPLQADNRAEITSRVVSEADFGVMFDPDGDRFFVIDKKGRFIQGDFLTAILSEYFLKHNPGATIVYDIRASLVVPETIKALGGTGLYNRVGHAYIKKRMIDEKAVFGGEVTGHYYFADFFYCDSGVMTLLYLLAYLSESSLSITEIIDQMESRYFISGEINSTVADGKAVIAKLKQRYAKEANEVLEIDGVSMELGEWRFNVRTSNTEPLIRLNLEARSKDLMAEKRDEVLALIRQ